MTDNKAGIGHISEAKIGEYPLLTVDLGKLGENIRKVTGLCKEHGIDVAGIVKGVNGVPSIMKEYDKSGVCMIGSSRTDQLRDIKKLGLQKATLLIRTPLLSEAGEVVKYADYSLNSENEVLRALNEKALEIGKVHKVILMAEMGDLREGYWGMHDLIEAALLVENELDGLYLAGIGMNVGCYGSILPTKEKMDEFVGLAEAVEKEIGRKLDVISGGATSSLLLVKEGIMPERVNHLRIGEAMLLAYDTNRAMKFDDLNADVFRVSGEVIEAKLKPTCPIGEKGKDAFANEQVYVDRGLRRRALVAMGKVDYGSESDIFPVQEGIEVIGASSDHTLIDIEDAPEDIKVGDMIDFRIDYVSMVYITQSRNVKIRFIGQ